MAGVFEHWTIELGENDGLIGTSTKCQKYFKDLEKAVKASLEADKEKEKSKERKVNLDLHVRIAKKEGGQLESLWQSHEMRCRLKPNDPYVCFSVYYSLHKITAIY